MRPKLKVLFLCTGNSCRSQMAEGWARRLHGVRIQPYSAGVAPGRLDPRAVTVMAEAGVDITSHYAKPLSEVSKIPFDVVVTVCDAARESCPTFPGTAHLVHHGFADPPRLAETAGAEEQALAPYRRVRDEIRAFIEQLPQALVASDANPGAT